MVVASLTAVLALCVAAPVLAGEPTSETRGFRWIVPEPSRGFVFDGLGSLPSEEREPETPLIKILRARRNAITAAGGAGASPRVQEQSGGTAAEWRALREAKRDQLAPPEKDGVEAGLAWVEDGHVLPRLRAGWHGFLPTLGGFPSGSGQAFGVVWTKTGLGVRYPDEDTPNRIDLRGWTALSLRGYKLALFETSLHRIAGTPLHLSALAGWQRNAGDSFYGIGPDSREQDRTSFAQEVPSIGIVAWWQMPEWLSIGGGVVHRDYSIEPGNDARFPTTGELFDSTEAPGLDRQPAFLTYDGFLEIDWRNDGNPYRGGLYTVRLSRWDDLDLDAFDHNDLDVELHQYFPFLKDTRVIALRARTILTDAPTGQAVPFYLMPRLGGSKELRGFKYGRFTDFNALLLSAEYRTEIWLAMDLALFVDAGKVFADHADLDFHDLRTSYGFGLRVKTSRSTFLRSDLAFGGESWRWDITFDNAFEAIPMARRILRMVQ